MKDRIHAAIMFTDIVGYTSLMGRDESKAFDMLSRNRAIHETHIKEFNGTLIKDIGDAILASFALATDAVRCAIKIQKSCKTDGIPLKIGIHEGEVLFTGTDVFGDGVNIASRLQSETQQGCINISASVYRDIKNKSDIQAKFIKEKTFKNVEEPIKIYEVYCDGDKGKKIESGIHRHFIARKKLVVPLIGIGFLAILAYTIWHFTTQQPQEVVEKSIAVLPLINDSPDKENEYFINGTMEAILDNLCKIQSLRVIGRTTVEQYRANPKSIPVMAKEMKVNYILEGSGQKYGNKIRLTLQLIDAKNDTHLWSKPYTREIVLGDIFSLQSEIAELVAAEIKAIVTPQEKHRIEKIPTMNLTAYDAYLKGKFYAKALGRSDLDSAMYYFELAKDIDPDYALAYAGICQVWLSKQQLGYDVSPEEAGPKSMEAITKALELDSTIAEVHYTLAIMNTFGMWDWKGGEKEFRKAIAINPNYAEAHMAFSHLLNILGQSKEAMEHIELALKLDPGNLMIKAFYVQDLIFVRRYEEVISISREILESDPTMNVTLDALFNALHQTGRYKEAFEVINTYYTTYYKDFNHVFDQFEKLGYVGTLDLEGDTLLAQSKSNFILPFDIANMFVFSDRREKALDCLENAYEVHDPNLPYLRRPTFDSLRHQPRFQAICKKMNIPCDD